MVVCEPFCVVRRRIAAHETMMALHRVSYDFVLRREVACGLEMLVFAAVGIAAGISNLGRVSHSSRQQKNVAKNLLRATFHALAKDLTPKWAADQLAGVEVHVFWWDLVPP